MATLVSKPAPDFGAQAVMPDGSFDQIELSDFKGMQRLLKISRFYFFMRPYLQSVLNVIEMRSIIRTFARFKLFFLGCSMKMTSLSKRTFYWRFLGSPPSSL